MASDLSSLREDLSNDEGLRFSLIVCGVAGAAYILRDLPHTSEVGLAFTLALPSALILRQRQGTLVFS
jgi:hypothetical protein